MIDWILWEDGMTEFFIKRIKRTHSTNRVQKFGSQLEMELKFWDRRRMARDLDGKDLSGIQCCDA